MLDHELLVEQRSPKPISTEVVEHRVPLGERREVAPCTPRGRGCCADHLEDMGDVRNEPMHASGPCFSITCATSSILGEAHRRDARRHRAPSFSAFVAEPPALAAAADATADAAPAVAAAATSPPPPPPTRRRPPPPPRRRRRPWWRRRPPSPPPRPRRRRPWWRRRRRPRPSSSHLRAPPCRRGDHCRRRAAGRAAVVHVVVVVVVGADRHRVLDLEPVGGGGACGSTT